MVPSESISPGHLTIIGPSENGVSIRYSVAITSSDITGSFIKHLRKKRMRTVHAKWASNDRLAGFCQKTNDPKFIFCFEFHFLL